MSFTTEITTSTAAKKHEERECRRRRGKIICLMLWGGGRWRCKHFTMLALCLLLGFLLILGMRMNFIQQNFGFFLHISMNHSTCKRLSINNSLEKVVPSSVFLPGGKSRLKLPEFICSRYAWMKSNVVYFFRHFKHNSHSPSHEFWHFSLIQTSGRTAIELGSTSINS